MVEYHYEDYIRAMKDAGLQERIRPNALDRAYKTSFLARSVENLFMGVYIIAIIGATVVIITCYIQFGFYHGLPGCHYRAKA